jgi:TrmH family RNA methyltransferase
MPVNHSPENRWDNYRYIITFTRLAALRRRRELGLRWPSYVPIFRATYDVIDDRNHPTIKRIRRLQERSVRDQQGLHYIEGMRFVARAVQHRVPVEALVVCRPLLAHPFARHLARRFAHAVTPILEVTPSVMSNIALMETSQGIGAVARQCWTPLSAIEPDEASCWVMLESVRSSGNLGTILRTSEAVGASGLMIPNGTVDPYDPATVRATMGSLFSQRFVRTSPDEFMRWKADRNCTLVGAAPSASVDYQDLDYAGPTVLLLGDERKGLSREWLARCDAVVRIPMSAGTDSLNLSVAASLLLYEVYNQRRLRSTPGTFDRAQPHDTHLYAW